MLKYRTIIYGLFAFVFAFALLVAPHGKVIAGSIGPGPHHGVTPDLTCSPGSGCTGKDPYQSGCSASQQQIGSAPLNVNLGGGYVYLMYSKSCLTYYSQVVASSYPVYYQKARIYGESSGISWYDSCNNCSGGWNSLMYYPRSGEVVAAYGDVIFTQGGTDYGNCVASNRGTC